MDQRAKEIIYIGDGLFSAKQPILSLWQTTCENFYCERADYTTVRSMGMEFASHLMTGIPVMASRDLANAVAAMLRPPGQIWFHPRTQSETINKDNNARRWLDGAGNVMRAFMYTHRSGWSRASKEGDRDYVTIGNALINVRPNRDFDGLLFRTIHMRDAAWAENDAGFIDTFHVKWKVSNRNLIRLFPKTVDEKVKKAEEKDPHGLVNCRQVVMPSIEYDSTMSKTEAAPGGATRRVGARLPYISIWVDCDHETILEEVGQRQTTYIPPRWSTVPGFAYGYSPPTVVNIADARMLQQITLTLLEAGQKAVDPPMQAASGEVIQGGVNLFAGGITWIDPEYDERSGPALKTLMGTNPNLGWGVDREKRIAEIIAEGHYLNQIRFPDTTHAKTAYEVQKLWEEFIRNTTPLFEPITAEYNGPVCDQIFEMMLNLNAFGPREDIPQILRGQDVRFQFESPLTLAQTRANVQAFTTVGQITSLAVQLDPTVVHDLDVDEAYRDALDGSGAPATWVVSKEKSDQMKRVARQQAAQQQALQQAANTVGQGADVAAKVGNAANMLQMGGILPPQQPQQGGAV